LRPFLESYNERYGTANIQEELKFGRKIKRGVDKDRGTAEWRIGLHRTVAAAATGSVKRALPDSHSGVYGSCLTARQPGCLLHGINRTKSLSPLQLSTILRLQTTRSPPTPTSPLRALHLSHQSTAPPPYSSYITTRVVIPMKWFLYPNYKTPLCGKGLRG